MPSKKRVIFVAPRQDIQPVKPEPPEDLWDRLGELEVELSIAQPPNSFTANEYARKRNLSRATAYSNLERLAKLGKVRKIMVPGTNRVYWQIL